MDFARTFGRSKSQLWGCRAAFWSEFRPEPGRRTLNETARDHTITYAVLKHGYKREAACPILLQVLLCPCVKALNRRETW